MSIDIRLEEIEVTVDSESMTAIYDSRINTLSFVHPSGHSKEKLPRINTSDYINLPNVCVAVREIHCDCTSKKLRGFECGWHDGGKRQSEAPNCRGEHTSNLVSIPSGTSIIIYDISGFQDSRIQARISGNYLLLPGVN